VRPHSFLTAVPFRELSEQHRALCAFWDSVEERSGAAPLEDAVDSTYGDGAGGRADLLKARACLAATGALPAVRVRSAVAAVAAGSADAVVLSETGGRPGLCRMTLSAEPAAPAAFRLTSISGRNPLLPPGPDDAPASDEAAGKP
jgi:hypothetical protein